MKMVAIKFVRGSENFFVFENASTSPALTCEAYKWSSVWSRIVDTKSDLYHAQNVLISVLEGKKSIQDKGHFYEVETVNNMIAQISFFDEATKVAHGETSEETSEAAVGVATDGSESDFVQSLKSKNV